MKFAIYILDSNKKNCFEVHHFVYFEVSYINDMFSDDPSPLGREILLQTVEEQKHKLMDTENLLKQRRLYPFA